MTDRPILFSAPMIRALLDGRKTMTRRILKPQPTMLPGVNPEFSQLVAKQGADGVWRVYGSEPASEPFKVRHRVGDRLWARETHYVWSAGYKDGSGQRISYRATEPDAPTSWTPGIHMPRWASRLTLTVTDVRVERLQDISMDDAAAEGLRYIDDGPGAGFWVVDDTPVCGDGSVEAYAQLWDHINGADAWAANPWVTATTFTVERRNIDSPGGAR